MVSNRSLHYRRLAGNLELFVGAYFAVFGVLAAIYFPSLGRKDLVPFCAAGALVGLLLVIRAGRLLAWRRWFFWTVALTMIVVPIAILAPALLR